ncbi:MAG TPA: DUF5996 family protein [Candidatus Limnocylindrales bacterium]|nr:DUF5996 family protein [Candidatus Limnocylindrales bacterium]
MATDRTGAGTAAVGVRGFPELPYAAWKDTMATLHMELQVIGKVRLALSPFEPQWANVPLYLTARGLTTSPMASGDRIFQVDVDLIDHQVVILTTTGDARCVALTARPVAHFYRDVVAALHALRIDVHISPRPSEVPNPIPFPEDLTHAAYDPAWATRFFHVLSRIDIVFKEHRSRFRGKTSLVNFFWGTFDLALLRYSGRDATPPEDGGVIMRKGADAEVICVGFWPGSAQVPAPSFFGYAFPAPEGIEKESLRPASAHWDPGVREFLLPYDDVRTAASPREAILEFCESVYAAGARLGHWDPRLLTGTATAAP